MAMQGVNMLTVQKDFGTLADVNIYNDIGGNYTITMSCGSVRERQLAYSEVIYH